MKLSFALPTVITAIILLSGCSGGSHSLTPKTTPQSSGRSAASAPAMPGSTTNKFQAAIGKPLSDSQIEAYIDSSVVGPDRVLLHKLMATMPNNLRGDLIFWDPTTGHKVSNNPAQLDYANISTGKTVPVSSNAAAGRMKPVVGSAINRSSQSVSVRRPSDYSTSCGPAPSNTGAYVRDVSACGMTDGWGFVNVTCGTSQFAYGDTGYLYMEIVGSGGENSGSAIEGGFQYNSDSSIQAYQRATYIANGVSPPYYQQMNYSSPNYKFGCGQTLTIIHGIAIANGNYIYTMVGQLPGNINIQSQYVNMNSQFFYPNNYVWIWTNPGPDMNGSGPDNAGYKTPCQYCSVSKVTSIAQNGGYNQDGSYFGTNGSQNFVNWYEVIFGEYTSTCNGQTGGTCQIASSPDPSVYFAGTQAFPYDSTAQTDMGPTGWGPYESSDGIAVGGSQYSGVVRKASVSFTEPQAPAPCTLDSAGYCAFATNVVAYGSCSYREPNPDYGDPGQPKFLTITENGSQTTYAIFHNQTPVKQMELTTYTDRYTSSGGSCVESGSWSPNDPAVAYGDSQLP